MKFLTNWSFAVRFEDGQIHYIKAGISQGSFLTPTLYNIFTSDIPHSDNTTFVTLADDVTIVSTALPSKHI